jgi:hypothetical protein
VRSATITCAGGCVVIRHANRRVDFIHGVSPRAQVHNRNIRGPTLEQAATVCLSIRQCSRIIIPLNPATRHRALNRRGPPEIFAQGTRPSKQKFFNSPPHRTDETAQTFARAATSSSTTKAIGRPAGSPKFPTPLQQVELQFNVALEQVRKASDGQIGVTFRTPQGRKEGKDGVPLVGRTGSYRRDEGPGLTGCRGRNVHPGFYPRSTTA